MTKDEEQLNLLSIFYFIIGGLTALLSLVTLVHIGIGLGIMISPEKFNDGGHPPPAWMGAVFAGMGALFLILGEAMALCMILVGRKLRARQSYMFCFVVSCIICLQFPFGTILGIFSIIVLNRDSVKVLFGREVAPPPLQPGSPQ